MCFVTNASTITRLKNYKMQAQRALQNTTAGTTKGRIARLKNYKIIEL
jgi:hypothetical protein